MSERLHLVLSQAQDRIVRIPRVMERALVMDLTQLWMKGIKLVLSLLILTILAALTGGVVKTFLDIGLLFHNAVEVALRQVIVDTLILLAVVEVFKTTLTYFSEGRVNVTFIVDTILVVMLTEVISQWFKGGELDPTGSTRRNAPDARSHASSRGTVLAGPRGYRPRSDLISSRS